MQGKTACFLAAIYAKARAFETMPNRREPVSSNMIKVIIKARGSQIRSVAYALTDFQILGYYAGLSLSKYAQPSATAITLTKDKRMPKAFLLYDIIFHGFGMTHRTKPQTQYLIPHAVNLTQARFREQKNGNHGKKVLFTAHSHEPDICPVHLMLRILSQAQRLGRSPSSPIGVAKRAGRVVHVHESMI